MHEKVQAFLNAKNTQERKKIEDAKRKTMLDLGLFEKEYSPDNTYSQEYPFMEYDGENKVNRYYKRVPIEISDEEFEEIKKYHHTENTVTHFDNKNKIATILTVIAWVIYVAGFISGIVFARVERGYYFTYTQFSLALAFVYWIAAFISGTTFLAFAEIIKLLNDIKNKK